MLHRSSMLILLFERKRHSAVVFLGSTSRLDGSTSSRDRSLWSLQQRSLSGGGGSAWARSTTTRDSPVLNGLNDGLSSLFSLVEHTGSTESLWRGDGGKIKVNYLMQSTDETNKTMTA